METEVRTPRYARTLDYYLLWLVALVSLILNVVIIRALLDARLQVGQAAGQAAQAVGQARASAIDYQVEINENLPISMTLHYEDTILVPISTTLPIDTNISVPLETPFGAIPLNFPVKTTIPVRIRPEVPLSVALPVSVTIPVNVVVPIHVELADTPLGASLHEAEQYLLDVAAQLGNPNPFALPTATALPATTPAATRTAPSATP